MLLWCINLHLHGEVVVLAQQVLHGVEIVLSHVGQPAAVVVPVATESLVGAVLVVGLIGCRTQPHVVVEMGGDGLLWQVFLAYPEEFPGKAGGSRHGDLQRPAEHTTVYKFLQGLYGGAQSVERVGETEPGVQAEHAAVALHCLDDGLALADGARHGLLTPDVLAGLGGLDGHDAVPVGRRGDVHHVDIGVTDQVAKVGIGFHALVQIVLCRIDSAAQVLGIDIADRRQPTRRAAREVRRGTANAAYADDAFRELVTRRNEFCSAQYVSRHNGEQACGT